MINSDDIKKIKDEVQEFFEKMTIAAFIEIKTAVLEKEGFIKEENIISNQIIDSVEISVKIDDPQIMIGEKGQTLIETQRILRTILNKKIGKIFYLNLDINEYRKKKIDYLKSLARDLADEVVLTKEEKVLLPMPSYERRIIHMELANRQDITTESQGEGLDRRVVIKPR